MMKFKFKTLTPLHISSGDELGYGLDYVIRYDMFCRLDFFKLSKILAEKKQFDFKKQYSLNEIINLFKESQNYLNKDDYLYRLIIRKDFFELVNNPSAEGQKFVREFVNSNNKFYIPASSIKGALLTILNIEKLGIDPNKAEIKDKFVIRDSDFISYENFVVMLTTNRPPKISLICLKKDVEFEMYVMKNGNLDIKELKNKLKDYSNKQINLAQKSIEKFINNRNNNSGANLFYEALQNISSVILEKDEYLLNIGFGGGSWFKVTKGRIPKFKSKSKKRKGIYEEAHTTVSFRINNNLNHIGWCKFKIEE